MDTTGNAEFDGKVAYHQRAGDALLWDRTDAGGIRLTAYFNPRTRELTMLQLFPGHIGGEVAEIILDPDEFDGIDRALTTVRSFASGLQAGG